jgi:predicted transcriptional regulator
VEPACQLPDVAPAYAAGRSELAEKMGLGRKPKAAEPVSGRESRLVAKNEEAG